MEELLLCSISMMWRSGAIEKRVVHNFLSMWADIQAETPLKAVILLMACHRLRWVFAASAREHGTSHIDRFDATEIQITYAYEEVY